MRMALYLYDFLFQSGHEQNIRLISIEEYSRDCLTTTSKNVTVVKNEKILTKCHKKKKEKSQTKLLEKLAVVLSFYLSF